MTNNKLICLSCGPENSAISGMIESLKNLIKKYANANLSNQNQIATYLAQNKATKPDIDSLSSILKFINLPENPKNKGKVHIEKVCEALEMQLEGYQSSKSHIRNINALFTVVRDKHGINWCPCIKQSQLMQAESDFQEKVNISLHEIFSDDKLLSVKDINYSAKVNKSNKEIYLSLVLTNDSQVKRSFKGATALEDAIRYCIALNDDDLVHKFNKRSLDSDEKIKNEEESLLAFINKHASDSSTVSSVNIITSKDIHPADRHLVKSRFQSIERHYCRITFANGAIIHTYIRHLKTHLLNEKWLHTMSETFYIREKAKIAAFRTHNQFLGPISKIYSYKNRGGEKKKHKTIEVHYTSTSHIYTYHYGDYLYERLPKTNVFCLRTETIKIKSEFNTLIFYFWSAQLNTINGTGKTIGKFGLTKSHIVTSELSELDCKTAVEKRIDEYCNYHALEIVPDTISIHLSESASIKDNRAKKMNQLERFLKKEATYTDVERVRIHISGISSLKATELIYGDIDVMKRFVKSQFIQRVGNNAA
jgi:hypothetical protein